MKKIFSFYAISILLLMLIFPVVSISVEHMSGISLGWLLMGKWFVFWAIGVRLFTAGMRQVIKPEFTAREIFHFAGQESFVVVRELGFANISMGLIGILSPIKTGWTQAAAISGGLYMGVAGIQHILKKPASLNEWVAMLSDLFIFAIATFYVIFTVIG